MKKVIGIVLLCIGSVGVAAAQQQHSVVEVHSGERWWGVATSMGTAMPIQPGGAAQKRSIITDNYANQAAPVLVSSTGRYIFSPEPLAFGFDGKRFVFTQAGVQALKGGRTLRQAFLTARDKHFKSNGQVPPELFFHAPQYNTWIELQYNQNQASIEQYASDLLRHGFPAGVLMIDDNWQRYYGNFEFKAERFADPRAMVERLHGQGFRVMLWVSPFVSPDSPEFRELERKGFLIKRKGSDKASLVRWWNGVSACYDLTNPQAFDHLVAQLRGVQERYGVDGFKFDAGDTYFYDPTRQDYFDPQATAVDQVQRWNAVGIGFPYNEYRAAYGMQQYPLVQRLNDKNHSWEALQSLVPEMINAGLLGYPYTCPDMIGGGQVADFRGGDLRIDQTLLVRSAQLHALMPMMQFSVAPWRILDAEHLSYCLEAARLHQTMAPYLLETVREAALTGEPIVRHMEYMFPGQGFFDCNDQYLLGSRLLVAPILSAEGKRTVRLPRGMWTDDRGQRFRGPVVLEVVAPTGRIPYYELNKK